MGTLKAGAVKLRIVIHVNKNDKGYTALFDSPDQKAFGLMVNKTELINDSLICDIQLIKGGYRASWNGKDQTYDEIDETFSPAAASIAENWILTESLKK
jgi:hypothetical protein